MLIAAVMSSGCQEEELTQEEVYTIARYLGHQQEERLENNGRRYRERFEIPEAEKVRGELRDFAERVTSELGGLKKLVSGLGETVEAKFAAIDARFTGLEARINRLESSEPKQGMNDFVWPDNFKPTE